MTDQAETLCGEQKAKQFGVVIKNDLPAEVVRECIDYDPEAGTFVWKKSTPVRGAGRSAGFVTSAGYLQIGINRTTIMAHRLAWIYVYGSPPLGFIDHINGNRLDNRICNLRDVEWALNTQNTRLARANNSVGPRFLGVSISASKSKPYKASITHNGKTRYIGIFKTPEEAHVAYIEAKRRLHPGCTI